MLESLPRSMTTARSAREPEAAWSLQAMRGFGVKLAGHDGIWLGLLLAAYLVALSIVGLDRSYVGHHENDFIKFFIPEAVRLLAGEPLQSRWHPPLYAMVLAGAYQVLGDWLTAGVVLSLASGLLALLASYLLFARLAGRPAAWGAVLALLCSAAFAEESIRASSDTFFLALFLGACVLAVEAQRTGSGRLWSLGGVLVGLALLTRSNAPPLLLLCLAPLVFPGPARMRLAHCLAAAGGVALPILALLVFAAATGSNLLPTDNHVNLAASYFADGQDRSSTDAALAVEGRFDSVVEVILHDPVLLARTYLLDLYRLASADLMMLVEPPLPLMFLPGLIFLLAAHASRLWLVIGGVLALEILMLNLKPFESRYYLFLIPLMGAAIGEMCWRILTFAGAPRRVLVPLAVGVFLLAGGLAVAKARHITRANVEELATVVPIARHAIDHPSTIVARKPNLAFYTEAGWLFLPDLATLRDLEAFLSGRSEDGPLYLYFGQVEQRYRPQLGALADSHGAPPWLDVIAASEPPGAWAFYRYRGTPTADDVQQ